MPRKTKEINEEKTVKKDSKPDEKINTFINAVLDIEEPVVDAKKKKAKSSKTKASTKEKVERATPKKTTKAKTKDEEKKTTKKETKSKNAEKSTKTVKKAATKSAEKISKETKKSSEKKATKTTKKTADKKSTKSTTKKSTSTKSTKTISKTIKKAAAPTVVEYYDLPYKYNQTVVKVLYQNPTTLFVYWEISDDDIENYKKQYGENFFESTRPVLVVYNDTMNYSFDVDINDFANSWYFNINDSKCDYRVELIRRPLFYTEKINTDYIYITSSNKIETPNDRILFSTNEPNTIYFKNTKNGVHRKVNLPKLLQQLNITSKDAHFPIIRNVYDLYKDIYHIEDVEEYSISLTNPSSASGNPSSHSLSSRFI